MQPASVAQRVQQVQREQLGWLVLSALLAQRAQRAQLVQQEQLGCLVLWALLAQRGQLGLQVLRVLLALLA